MQSKFRDDPQHWRWRAQEARIHAELIIDPDSRHTMLEIADEYERIAQRAEGRMRDSETRTLLRQSAVPSIRRKRWF
jgi:hypothetical protein